MKEKNLIAINLFLSSLVILFLIWYIYFFQKSTAVPTWLHLLPYLNAIFNSFSFICLIKAVREIKKKNIERHKKLIFLSLFYSALFLVSYLTHHYFVGDTKFLTHGLLRPIYFFILITHIVTSIIVVPLIMISVTFGLTNKIDRHRKLVKWTYPIWSYVSVTGVLIVIFIKFLNTTS
ncbi:DUF420 domain-containing protein [Bacteriovoracaceae bacterium]|nr:DUF420 domain-containing protein [Bacteriovoracaceae bacterium]